MKSRSLGGALALAAVAAVFVHPVEAAPGLDPLASAEAARFAREAGALVGRWEADELSGYHLVTIRGAAAELETLAGKPPARTEWAPARALARGDVLVIDTNAGARVRVLEQPHDGNGLAAVVEIDARRSPGPVKLALHAVALAKVLERFFVRGELEDLQRRAISAELEGKHALALDGWEEIARRFPGRELRLWALERFYALHPRVTFALGDADRRAVEDAKRRYPDPGVLAGKHVVGVFWKDYAARAVVRRLMAELDAVHSALGALTSEKTNEAWGRKLLVRYFTEAEGEGLSIYADHSVLVGAKKGELPVERTWGAYSHELAHDFFHLENMHPYPGFGEGWPDFARVFIYDLLGWDEWRDDALRQYEDAFAAFKKSGRPLTELPGYAANAGLLVEVARRLGGAPSISWERVGAWIRSLARTETPPAPEARPRHFVHWLGLGKEAVPFARSLGFAVTEDDLALAARELAEVDRFGEARRLAEKGKNAEAAEVLEELASRRSPFAAEAISRLIDRREALGQREKAVELAARLGVARDWLIVGPFQLAKDAGFEKALAPEGPFDRTAAFSSASSSTPLRWRAHSTEDPRGRVSFDHAFGKLEHALAYATAVVECDRRCSIEIRIQHDDDFELFLDGRSILAARKASPMIWDSERVEVELAPGAHRLLVKVMNRAGEWGFGVRLCTKSGVAAAGVSAR